MRATITIALLLICSLGVFAQEAEKSNLPHDAQTAMDAFNKTQAKLEDDYKHKVGVEREKLYALLDKASKEAAKKGDADGIVAIKAEMKKIIAESSKDDDTDLLGVKQTAATLIDGKWNLGTTGIVWVFTSDNKCVSQPSGVQGTWAMAKNEKEIEVHWSTNESDTIATNPKMVATTPGGMIPLTPAK